MEQESQTTKGESRPGERGGRPAAAEVQKDSGNTLATRVVSGVVYAALFIGCLLAGPVPSALFVALLSGLCCYEFFAMVRRDGKVPNIALGTAAGVLFPLAALGESIAMTALIFLFVLSCGLWYVYTPRTRISDVAVTLMGPLYTGFMLSSIVLLRDAEPGFAGALLAIGSCASLWVCDSFAYLIGRQFGRHKMAPKISPKKSWEGFAGGIAGSILVWLIVWATHLFPLDLWYALLTAVVVGVLGVFGDLIESRIKRGVGVKDSGNIIPGHGGMLDRCDSLIFGCITAQLMLYIGGVL